jgi:hypothetical protein
MARSKSSAPANEGRHRCRFGLPDDELLQRHREMQVGYRRLVTLSTENLFEKTSASRNTRTRNTIR